MTSRLGAVLGHREKFDVATWRDSHEGLEVYPPLYPGRAIYDDRIAMQALCVALGVGGDVEDLLNSRGNNVSSAIVAREGRREHYPISHGRSISCGVQ